MRIIEILQEVGSRKTTYDPIFADLDKIPEGRLSNTSLDSEDGKLFMMPPEKRSVKENERADKALVDDMIYFSLEVIERYLKYNYPDAVLDRETLKIDGEMAADNQELLSLKTLLDELRKEKRSAKYKLYVDPSSSYTSISFVIKDLIENDRSYSYLDGVSTKLYKALLRESKEKEMTADNPTVQNLKTLYKTAKRSEEISFEPNNFIEFCEAVITNAERRNELSLYADELLRLTSCEIDELDEGITIFESCYKPGQGISPKDYAIRAFCIEATNEEFDELLYALMDYIEPDTRPVQDVKIPVGNQAYGSSLRPLRRKGKDHKYYKEKKYLISPRGANPEIYGIYVFHDPEENRIYLTPEESELLNISNARWHMNGDRPVKISLKSLYSDTNKSRTPTPKQIESLHIMMNLLGSYKVRTEYEAKDINTGKVIRLDPLHPENLPYFMQQTSYRFTAEEFYLSMQDKDLISVKSMGLHEYRNGTAAWAFKLLEQPVMNKLAEANNQVRLIDPILYKETKGETIKRIVNAFVQKELQYKEHDWTYNLKDFLKRHHIVEGVDELDDKRKMYRYRQETMRALILLCEQGLIEDFNMNKATGNFYVIPALPDLSGKNKDKRLESVQDHKKLKEATRNKFRKQQPDGEITQVIGHKGSELKTLHQAEYIESKDVKIQKDGSKIGWTVKGKLL